MRKDEMEKIMRQVGELCRPRTWEETERESRHAIWFLAGLTAGLFLVVIFLGIYTRS